MKTRIAYIDIGYNAMRAVVYDCNKLGSAEIFSEKFRSDILALLQLENLDTKHQTYLALQYLVHIFKKLSVKDIKCVATAVLRGHPRAEEFQKIIKQKFDIEIEILSGEKEAYLTALGLISGINNAKGVAADLGGGSLELAELADRKIGKLKSLALGTKLMQENNINSLEFVINSIKREFGSANYDNLYFIGGGLRFLGRFYMDFTHYPLKNLHNFEIFGPDFKIYLEKLDHIHKIKQTHQYKNRIDPYAILIAKAMMEIFNPQNIIISNYGLKEGMYFSSLPQEEQNKDIIYERIKKFTDIQKDEDRFSQYNQLICKILIKPDNNIKQVINYVIMLAQLNKNIDKTLRANFAVEFVLACDVPFTHQQRLIICVSLATAFGTKPEIYINRLAKKMLSRKNYYNGQIIGNIIKIAKIIDGPEFLSPSFSLEIKEPYIQISTIEKLPHHIFEKIFERLKNISYARKSIRIGENRIFQPETV